MTDTQALVLMAAKDVANAKCGGTMTTADIIKSLGVSTSEEKEQIRRAIQFHLRPTFDRRCSDHLKRVFDEGSSGRSLTFKYVLLSIVVPF